MITHTDEPNCVAMAGMNADLLTGDRMVVVGADGHLWPCDGDGRSLAEAQIFSVVVVWAAAAEPMPWAGWLTSINRWSFRFSPMELDDVAFRCWLEGLPGWCPGKLSSALALPGMHLVWRRAPD